MLAFTYLFASIVTLAPTERAFAIAVHPQGRAIAVGRLNSVILLADGKNAGVVGRTFLSVIPDLPGRATALAFNKAGTRLAVGVSKPGVSGELRVYEFGAGAADWKPAWTVRAHRDSIHNIAFAPDGRTVATCGYDKLAKLFDAATGAVSKTLNDHSDSVYDLSFSPDGKQIATVAADRTVKIWSTADGKRLLTLAEATDWLYACAWSPDGEHLAAAGIDRSLRVWKVTADSATIVKSAFAHEGAVLRLAYSADGKTLVSVGEDRVIKTWDAARLVELKVFDKQTQLVTAVAFAGANLAIARHDGSAALFDLASGKPAAELLPLPVPKPMPPVLSAIAPDSGSSATIVEVTFTGTALAGAAIVGLPAGVSAKALPSTDTRASFMLAIEGAAITGPASLSLKTPHGETAKLPFHVDPFPSIVEAEPNDNRTAAQTVKLNTTVVGVLSRAGDVDHFAFDAPVGAQLGVELLTAAPAAKFVPALALVDASGTVVAEGDGSTLSHIFAQSGRYVIRVRDAEYRGGADIAYRLSSGNLPVVSDVFPLGLTRGSSTKVTVRGANLGGDLETAVAAGDAMVGAKLPVKVSVVGRAALSARTVVVGEFPSVRETEPNDAASGAGKLPVPGTADGRIDKPNDVDTYRFTARKGQPLILEVEAARLGSKLDSVLEILDLQGKPVSRAVLRCLAKTYTVFRDHDSRNSGIRIEAWSELAVDDYVMVGDELLRIQALPRNPDDDCRFYTYRGRRRGYFDTTPSHQSIGRPIFKVKAFPPGTVFPPNGMPVFELFHRNDDAQGVSGDSQINFDPPADGDYLVRIGDVRGLAGPDHAYRLTVREPRPDFRVTVSPNNPMVPRGGSIPVSVNIERLDGFEGPIQVELQDVPAGFAAPTTGVQAEQIATAFALGADAKAVAPAKTSKPMRLVARAPIDGKAVVREAAAGVPQPIDPGDIVCETASPEVRIAPGAISVILVKIERRNNFKGRIPLDVRGLPHGVRVLDVGLNGILITEGETQREVRLFAEPWAQPLDHPIVVLATHEGKKTEHGAPSVLLRVGK